MAAATAGVARPSVRVGPNPPPAEVIASCLPRAIRTTSLIDVLLLLAPLAVVPLGLRLVGYFDGVPRLLLRAALVVQPFAAVAVVASFLMPVGWTAGLLTAPWLLVGGVAALGGLGQLVGGPFRLPRLVVTAALAYLAVGADWLALSRFG